MAFIKTNRLKKNFPALSEMVNSMYDKRAFCVSSLHRKFCPVMYISENKNIRNRKYDYKLEFGDRRNGKQGSGFYDFCLDGTVRVTIDWTTIYSDTRVFSFNVATNKELMQKLIHYNLIG